MQPAEPGRTDGLASSVAGYSLVSRAHGAAARHAPPSSASASSTRPAARATNFDVDGGVRLHLIVVRRDLTGYQHLHPRAAARRHVDACPSTLAAPGAYRAYADFEVDGTKTVLGTDLFVAGTFTPAAAVAAARACTRRRLRRRAGARRATRRRGERARVPRPPRRATGHPRSTSTSAAAAISLHCTRATSRTRTSIRLPARRPARSASTPSSRRPARIACSCSSRRTASSTPSRSRVGWHDERRRAPRPADRGDDLRVVRCAHRAALEQARRRQRVGQLRDREGGRRVRPRSGDAARAGRGGRGGGLLRTPADGRAGACRGIARRRPAPAARRRVPCSRCRCSRWG